LKIFFSYAEDVSENIFSMCSDWSGCLSPGRAALFKIINILWVEKTRLKQVAFDKLKHSREYKAYRRTVDSNFVENERAARKRYAKKLYQFNKLARAFANTNHALFKQFVQALQKKGK
jgi:hypothetical protein